MRTKLKVVTPKTYQNKPNGYSITLEDGTVGNLAEKDSDKDLKVGEEVECTITDYISKQGKHSNLFTIRRGPFTPSPLPSPLPPPPTPLTTTPPPPVTTPSFKVPQVYNEDVVRAKVDATIQSMRFMIDCFIADKLTWDQIQPKFKELSGYMWDAIDECNQ